MRSQQGFTLIEILMVVVLVGILAAVSIPQFVDFRSDAKDAATKSALSTLRTAIMNQYAQMKLRCNAGSGVFPTAAQIAANNITTGGTPCTTAMITDANDRKFVANTAIPDNPWSGGTVKNSVTACTAGGGCNQADTTDCAGNAYSATSSGWCYNPATGQIWANSRLSSNTTKEHTF